MDSVNLKECIPEYIKKYKFVALILAVGIVLMLVPERKTGYDNNETSKSIPQETEMTLEDSLEEILSHIEGAGKVRILLTYSSGERTHYQVDEDITSGELNADSRRETVIIKDSGRGESGLVQWVDAPSYLGAIILCQGAGDSSVRLAITDAVRSATGLSAHKITVLKMK